MENIIIDSNQMASTADGAAGHWTENYVMQL